MSVIWSTDGKMPAGFESFKPTQVLGSTTTGQPKEHNVALSADQSYMTPEIVSALNKLKNNGIV